MIEPVVLTVRSLERSLAFEQCAAGPRDALDAGEDVEFARLDGLGLAEDDEVVCPRQLSHQR